MWFQLVQSHWKPLWHIFLKVYSYCVSVAYYIPYICTYMGLCVIAIFIT